MVSIEDFIHRLQFRNVVNFSRLWKIDGGSSGQALLTCRATSNSSFSKVDDDDDDNDDV